jgi:ribosome-associated translation inhibitor RaiA
VTTPATTAVQLTAPKDLAREVVEEARARMTELARLTDAPLMRARLTLRQPDTRPARARWTADASVLLDGRPLAAHATGRNALHATDEVVDRLRRQIRRVIDAGVAQRDEPRVLERALAALPYEPRHRPAARRKPPELRDVIPRPTPYPLPESTFDAVADLIDLDLEFLLFTHERTGEDVVVHRRDDGRIGLLHPPGSPLADEDGLVVPEPSRYPEPITLERARNEMDVLEHRFLYFIDRADGHGKVLYLRHDGDYGLVTPPSRPAAAAG